jgi:putative MATE family efflux protein
MKKARLTEGDVAPLLIRLTVPMVFGILSIVMYNIVDTLFVGRLGRDQLAALSFTFPVVMVISSIALGLGMGASAAVSRAIGTGDENRVRRLATDSLVLALLIVGAFAVAGLLTIGPLFRLLGADETVLHYIREYMSIWYPGMIFVVVPMVGNNTIRATGDTRTPGIVMMIGALANAVFDPLLILGLGPFPELGIRGAATATLLGRSITFAVALHVLGRRERLLTFRKVRFAAILSSWKEVLYVGVPAAAARLIVPVGAGIVTRILARYGPSVVAGYGVATRIEFFALATVNALAAVVAPFVGQNLGAKRYDRIRTGFRTSQAISGIVGLFFFLMLMAIARPVAGLFARTPDVIEVTVAYLRIVPFAYAFQGFYLFSGPGLNVLRKPLLAAGLGGAEMFVLIAPLSLVGARLLGPPGVFAAIATGYVVTGLLSSWSFSRAIRALSD